MAMNRPSPISSVLSWITAFCCFFPLMAADEATRTYIVHMDKSAMPTAFADHHAWYTATLSKATTGRHLLSAVSGQHPQLIYAYTHAIDGFSARLTTAQLEQLEASPGFLSAYPDVRLKLATTHTPDFLGLNSQSGIWPKSHYGQGAIIGVIDSGIWPESPSFRDDGMPPVPSRWRGACEPGENFTVAMCNRKLIGARYFNKALRVNPPDFITIDDSPRDKLGHGTHVAAVAAGNFVEGASYFGYATGTARGVAPRAHLAIYKVAWWDTPIGFSSADVLAAIDQAVADGVDVITLSLEIDEDVPLYQNPVAIAAFSALEKGVFVTTAAGNRGFPYKSVYLGVPWALTVGESTIDRQLSGTVVLGDGTTINGGSLYVGEPTSTGQLPLVNNVDCQNDTDLRLHHKHHIVVCRALEASYLIDLDIGVRDAQIAGAIFSLSADLMPGFIKYEFSATSVDLHEGDRITDYINKTAHPTASLQFRNTVTGTRAPAVCRTSSRGPARSCPDVLKPDIVAPGSLVLAAYPPISEVSRLHGEDVYGPFNIISGTSVACPHAAAVAAMLKVLHPDWSPSAILSAMVTTANPTDNTGRPIVDLSGGEPANPLTMGSGQLNPNPALDPGLVYDAGVDDYLSFLCAMNFTKKQIRTIIRSNTIKVDCSGTHSPLDLNYPSFIGFFDPDDLSSAPGSRLVREFHRTVTNVADGAWTYTANWTNMDGFSVSVTPHRLVFKQKHEKQSFTLRIVGHRKLSSYDVIYGSLNWVDDQGKHVVRSPIVATVHDLLPDHDDD